MSLHASALQSMDTDDLCELRECLRCRKLYEFPADGCPECDGYTCPPCIKQVSGDDDEIKFSCVDCKAKEERQLEEHRFAAQIQCIKRRMAKYAAQAQTMINFDKLGEDAEKMETQRYLRSQARKSDGRLPAGPSELPSTRKRKRPVDMSSLASN